MIILRFHFAYYLFIHVITDTNKCTSDSLARIILNTNYFGTKEFEIKEELGEGKRIGEEIAIGCKNALKKLSKDAWDGDSSDNILHVRCRYDGNFDLPSNSDMPLCLAQCPTENVLPENRNMVLDIQSRKQMWEYEKIW